MKKSAHKRMAVPDKRDVLISRYLLWLMVTSLLIIADLLTKRLVQGIVLSLGFDLSDPQLAVEIKEFYSGASLVFVKNYGVSFGLFNWPDAPFFQQGFLIFLALGVSLFLAFQVRHVTSLCGFYGTSLICSGALGNAASRFFDGYVTDFVDLSVGGWHWPAFNVADIAISLGAFFYFLALLHEEKNKGKK